MCSQNSNAEVALFLTHEGLD